MATRVVSTYLWSASWSLRNFLNGQTFLSGPLNSVGGTIGLSISAKTWQSDCPAPRGTPYKWKRNTDGCRDLRRSCLFRFLSLWRWELRANGYPWHWSVYRWLEGEDAANALVADLPQFAVTLADFLIGLQRIDPTGGPLPGPHNFFRGGPLSIYDSETRQAIATLADRIDADAVTAIWKAALAAAWHGPPSGCTETSAQATCW